MGSPPPERGRRRSTGALVLLGGGAMILVYCVCSSFIFPSSDFLGFYAAATLASRGEMYDTQAIDRVEKTYGRIEIPKPFHRPPFYALALAPLALLPYRWALVLWQALNLLALGAFMRLWPARDRFRAVLLTLWFAPLWFAVGLAQDTALLLFCIALAAWLLERQRPVLAGVVLAVCSFKANLLLGLPVVLLARRMGRVCVGAALGGVAVYLVSAIPDGLAWPVGYLAALRRTTELLPVAPYSPTLAGLVQSLPEALRWIRWPLVGLTASLLFAACRRISGARSIGMAFLTGVLLSPFSYVYDASILLPGVIDTVEGGRAVAAVPAVILGMGLFISDKTGITWIGHGCVMLIFAGAVRAALGKDGASREAPTLTI